MHGMPWSPTDDGGLFFLIEILKNPRADDGESSSYATLVLIGHNLDRWIKTDCV